MTGNKAPCEHVTDTKCRPDIVAVFEGESDDDGTIYWPSICISGEYASKGKTPKEQEIQAVSYLHYLLLARPDLYVAQGMLVSDKRIVFLFGIGGRGVRSFEVGVDDSSLSELLFAFIYRIYQPGDFRDPSYQMDPIIANGPATWTITLAVKSQDGNEQDVVCPDFLPLYASSPFQTRTHVFANSSAEVTVHGKKLSVIKDQLCGIKNRFSEHTIFQRIHNPERVPGVVESVYHDLIYPPPRFGVGRIKHRHGLRQVGLSFTSIPTTREMLKVAFDVIEGSAVTVNVATFTDAFAVLRFLRFKRNILHRDISAGNVMYAPTGEHEDECEASTLVGGHTPVFVEQILGESGNHRRTSALLIDFNHAEDLADKEGPEYERVMRTGTPVFMARAVEIGVPVRPAIINRQQFLAAIPPSPDPYTKYHGDRVKRFPEGPDIARPSIKTTVHRSLRQELDHDIESVFWLMLYWAVTSQPVLEATEYIARATWEGLVNGVEGRGALLFNVYSQNLEARSLHSTLNPLLPLLSQLAEILVSVDRHWLDDGEIRNDPEYSAEAFQRLILQFILENSKNAFIDAVIDTSSRQLDPKTKEVPRTGTKNQILHASSQQKRQCPSAEQSDAKRLRMNQEPKVCSWSASFILRFRGLTLES
ncbi:hypothetical protein FRB90_002538 [Tulasnella sp. 427]|nr:hypothetical protein FRB90_002538 [Tulasnella sp. 427]